MSRAGRNDRAFTLIELLVVIGIISILTAMTMTVGPRVIRMAKIGRVEGDMKSLWNAVQAYRIDEDTCPPAIFDVLKGKDLDNDPNTTEQSPSMVRYLERLDLGRQQESAFYDVFTSQPKAPYIYIPAYSKNADTVLKFLAEQSDLRPYAQYSTLLDAIRTDLRSQLYLPTERRGAPPRFDTWVFLSVGPEDPEKKYGGLAPDISDLNLSDGLDDEELAEIRMRRLTAYVLATIDKDDNKYLDYDYRTRTKKLGLLMPDGGFEPLPDGTFLPGPIIGMGG